MGLPKVSEKCIHDENLQLLLKNNALNANQLGQTLGVPMMTIRRLLSGKTTDPRISTLKQIADHFKVSVDFLIAVGSNILPYLKEHHEIVGVNLFTV